MPKPRKSLAELAASGTLGKNLGRYQSRLDALPTVIHPPGRAPVHFDPQQKAVWAEVLRTAPEGLLMKSDRIVVEVLVRLLLKVRTSDGSTSEMNSLINLLGKMGMTPASRRAMNVERAPDPHETAAEIKDKALWAELDALD
jgi:phage terminase small subunit